jgi:hypothetical protein
MHVFSVRRRNASGCVVGAQSWGEPCERDGKSLSLSEPESMFDAELAEIESDSE